MRLTTRLQSTVRAARAAALFGIVGVVGQVLFAGPADAAAATTVTRVELKSGQLRIEGATAGAGFVGVESTASSAGGYAGQNFAFKIQADGFAAPTCTITVRGINAPDLSVGVPDCTPTA